MSITRSLSKRKGDDEKISESDFDSICRFCMTKLTELIDIHQTEIEKITLQRLGIPVKKGDGLPCHICAKCDTKLKYFDEFCGMVNSSVFYLQSLKNKSKIEIRAPGSKRKGRKPAGGDEKKSKFDIRKKEDLEESKTGRVISEEEVHRITETEDEVFMLIVGNTPKIENDDNDNEERDEDSATLGDEEEMPQPEEVMIREQYTLEDVEDEVIGEEDIFDEEQDQASEKVMMEDHSYTRITNEDGEVEEQVDEENVAAVESLVALADVPTEAGVVDIDTTKPEESKFDFTHNYALADDPENKIYRVMLESNICEECDTEFMSLRALSKHYFQVHDTVLVLADSLLLTCPICKENWRISEKQQFIQHLCTYKPLGYHFVKVNKYGKAIKPLKRESEAFTPLSTVRELLTNEISEVKQTFEYSEADSSDNEMQFVERSNFDYLTEELENKKKTPTGAKKGSALLNHLKTTFFCDICGKGCGGKANLNRHYTTHAKDNNKNKIVPRLLECAICAKVFNSKLSLKEHLIHHNNEKLTSADGGVNYVCSICNERFASKSMLVVHSLSHKDDSTIQSRKCFICTKLFFTDANFEKHLQEHMNPNNPVCDICNVAFDSLKQLNNHMNVHETSKTVTFDCEVCNISFVTENNLNEHKIKSGHDIITIECVDCSLNFPNINEYTDHVDGHPPNERCHCGLCGKQMINNEVLSKHIKQHLQSCEYLCPDCGERFPDHDLYEKHVSSHQNKKVYVCEVESCSKAFYTIKEYQKHKKVCNNEESYECDICSKRFPLEAHLTVHMRIHTGERPYSCPHCSKCFITKTICKKHIINEHNGVEIENIHSLLNKEEMEVFQIEES